MLFVSNNIAQRSYLFRLVSNAPHIPVHLGAMQEAVQYQVRDLFYVVFLLYCCLTKDTLIDYS